MSTAQDFVLLDFGVALTKGFLLSESSDASGPHFVVKNRVIAPTTVPELEICYKNIIKNLGSEKKAKIILTSSFLKKEAIGAFSSEVFIDTEDSYTSLKKFFGRSQFDILFLDAGSSNWLQNFDPTVVGALTLHRMTDLEIENYLGNKRRYLFSQPIDENQVDIETAFLKNYILSRGISHGKRNTLVLATGGMFSYSPNLKLTLETIVDTLTAPYCQVLLDRLAFLPAFGAFLTVVPEKMEILQVPGLKNLAALINLGGPGQMEVDFGIGSNQKVSVGVDQLTILPAERDKEIVIKTINKQDSNSRVTVGELGVVIDGRVKPLDLVPRTDSAREKIKKWREVYTDMII